MPIKAYVTTVLLERSNNHDGIWEWDSLECFALMGFVVRTLQMINIQKHFELDFLQKSCQFLFSLFYQNSRQN